MRQATHKDSLNSLEGVIIIILLSLAIMIIEAIQATKRNLTLKFNDMKNLLFLIILYTLTIISFFSDNAELIAFLALTS